MANSKVDITIDDVLFNDTNMETQTLCPNGFPWCGLKEKAYVLLCTLIHRVTFMVILWLTSQLGHVLFNSIFNISLDYGNPNIMSQWISLVWLEREGLQSPMYLNTIVLYLW
jgi:hypothetical protein